MYSLCVVYRSRIFCCIAVAPKTLAVKESLSGRRQRVSMAWLENQFGEECCDRLIARSAGVAFT